MPEFNSRYVVVGVSPRHPAQVVTAAAKFAKQFDASLVCVTVDASRYVVERRTDGSVISMSIDADAADATVEEFDVKLHQALAGILDPLAVPWTTRALAGEPAQELSRLANDLDAEMVIVGSRETGIRGSLHKFFGRSVAIQLAHLQHRPVVVVPLNPVGRGRALPWQEVK